MAPLGGSLRQPSTQQQTSQCEPRDKNGQDENKKEKIIPFLQLGRLVPYSDRKTMLSDKVPALSVILQKKRRHSSDRSDNLRSDDKFDELMPLNKAPKIDSTGKSNSVPKVIFLQAAEFSG
jgi:hypothetical protein